MSPRALTELSFEMLRDEEQNVVKHRRKATQKPVVRVWQSLAVPVFLSSEIFRRDFFLLMHGLFAGVGSEAAGVF